RGGARSCGTLDHRPDRGDRGRVGEEDDLGHWHRLHGEGAVWPGKFHAVSEIAIEQPVRTPSPGNPGEADFEWHAPSGRRCNRVGTGPRLVREGDCNRDELSG